MSHGRGGIQHCHGEIRRRTDADPAVSPGIKQADVLPLHEEWGIQLQRIHGCAAFRPVAVGLPIRDQVPGWEQLRRCLVAGLCRKAEIDRLPGLCHKAGVQSDAIGHTPLAQVDNLIAEAEPVPVQLIGNLQPAAEWECLPVFRSGKDFQSAPHFGELHFRPGLHPIPLGVISHPMECVGRSVLRHGIAVALKCKTVVPNPVWRRKQDRRAEGWHPLKKSAPGGLRRSVPFPLPQKSTGFHAHARIDMQLGAPARILLRIENPAIPPGSVDARNDFPSKFHSRHSSAIITIPRSR